MVDLIAILANSATNDAAVSALSDGNGGAVNAGKATGVAALAVFGSRYAFIILKMFFLEGGFTFQQFKEQFPAMAKQKGDGIHVLYDNNFGRAVAYYRKDGQVVDARAYNIENLDERLHEFGEDVSQRKYQTGITTLDIEEGRMPAAGKWKGRKK